MLLGGEEGEGEAQEAAPLAPEQTAWMLQPARPWRMQSWMAGARPAAGGTRLGLGRAGPEAAAALPLAATALQEEEGAAAPAAVASAAVAAPQWQQMMMAQPAM